MVPSRCRDEGEAILRARWLLRYYSYSGHDPAAGHNSGTYCAVACIERIGNVMYRLVEGLISGLVVGCQLKWSISVV